MSQLFDGPEEREQKSKEQVRMYYASGTVVRIYYQRTLSVHSPGSSTFLREMTSWPPSRKCDVKRQIKNPTPSIDAYLFEGRPAKFHPDPI